MESPTNPLLTVIDLKGVADVAHKKVQRTPVIIILIMINLFVSELYSGG